MKKAAGILFIAPGDLALFLKRAGPDHAGEWCLPGGGLEDGESWEDAAKREAAEETGRNFDGELEYLARSRQQPQDGQDSAVATDYTTFSCRVKVPFDVTISAESTGYAWAPVKSPPQPLHPGVQSALSRLTMETELDVARAIAAGTLTSPQPYGNSWYFAMRITGVGAAYRRSWDEYVWRDPSIYMNEEFLARCNGLPIILEHPDSDTLNTKEFAQRVIGTMFLPYLDREKNEVWGVARIIDAPAAKLMEDQVLSTSPAVVFKEVGTQLTDQEGRNILIENTPFLVDHLAVCRAGVWDRGGPPEGIESATVGDRASFADSAGNERITKLDRALASLTKSRMDSAASSLRRCAR